MSVRRGEDAPAVLRGCRAFLAAHAQVTLNLALMQVPDRAGTPPPLVGCRRVYVHGMLADLVLEAAAEAIRPLRHLVAPVVDLSGPADYFTQHTALDALIPPLHTGYADSTYVRDLSDGLLNTAAAHVAADATAFGDRRAGALVMMESTWEDASERAAGVEWVRAVRRDLAPHHYNGGTYLNLTGGDHPDYDLIAATHGNNWRRRQAIKRQHDPDNRFRFNANILAGEPAH